MSKIYNHPDSEWGYCIGHVNSDGKIYNHPDSEWGYCIGHVNSNGKIYNHPDSEWGYCIGHVNSDGKIYNHPDSEWGYCIGHVNSDGKIYNHPDSEWGYCIGHVEKGCPISFAGGAALILLLAGATTYSEQEKPSETTKGRNSSEQSSSSPNRGGFWRSELGVFFVIVAVFAILKSFEDLFENLSLAALSPALITVIVSVIVGACIGMYLRRRRTTKNRRSGINAQSFPRFDENATSPQRNSNAANSRENESHLHHSDASHNYFSCPHCHMILRVPKGEGRIQITCSNCKMRFNVDD